MKNIESYKLIINFYSAELRATDPAGTMRVIEKLIKKERYENRVINGCKS